MPYHNQDGHEKTNHDAVALPTTVMQGVGLCGQGTVEAPENYVLTVSPEREGTDLFPELIRHPYTQVQAWARPLPPKTGSRARASVIIAPVGPLGGFGLFPCEGMTC